MTAINFLSYVPVLKWRQGEYQALMKLDATLKNRVVPLIEITPPDFDFEAWQPAKSIDDHLFKFAARLKAKWGTRPALVDTGLLAPGERMIGGVHPLLWLMDQVRPNGAHLIPVTTFECDAAHCNAVRIANIVDGCGAALRCSLEDATDPNFNATVQQHLASLEILMEDLDVVIDLKSPNFEPVDGLAELLVETLAATSFSHTRSVTIVGTAFPESMAQITGPIQVVRRQEWLLYKALIAKLSPDGVHPAFGDYAIASHGLPQIDMRKIKPAATVRYATNDNWIIAKGPNVRDNGFGQYREWCRRVTQTPGFLGRSFSPGGDYIDDCSAGNASTGNLSTWRWVGTNHHMTKVVRDLATLHGT